MAESDEALSPLEAPDVAVEALPLSCWPSNVSPFHPEACPTQRPQGPQAVPWTSGHSPQGQEQPQAHLLRRPDPQTVGETWSP